MNKYIMPHKIICVKDVDFAERFLQEKELQASVNDECAVIKKNGYILFDFGRELCGGIAITVRKTSIDPKCARLRVVFGESVMESLSEIGLKNSTNNHSMRDTDIAVSYLSTYHHGSTGFRFVKIEALDADIHIKAIKAETDICDFEHRGSFECNDELLNEIWKVGAYTVQLNMHDFIWDGVKRDRLVWIGDMHPEVSVVSAVFGDVECVKKSLDFARDTTPIGKWMNNIATYSIWWLIIHYDLYMHWGDKEYLKEQKEYMLALIDYIFKYVESLFEGNGEPVHFVDWSSKGTESENEGCKAISCIGIECAEKLFNFLGEYSCAKRCSEYIEKIRTEKIEKASNKRISALTVLSGRDKSFAEKMISGNSAEEMSCFLGYYVLKAKAMLGDYKETLDIIREYWGGMLKMGATTFWEDFDIRWMKNSAKIDEITPDGMNDIHGDFGKYCYMGYRHSLCHGWASGPTPFLMEQIGGIEILEPGCKKVKVSPNLGNLEWVNIEYPTPYGNIVIKCRKEHGDTILDVSAPKEIEVV